jgi:hypothetical protein
MPYHVGDAVDVNVMIVILNPVTVVCLHVGTYELEGNELFTHRPPSYSVLKYLIKT